MINEFEYKGFEPSEEMQAEANAIIEEILDVAPKRVTIAAMIDFDGKQYHCSIDTFLRRGSVTASVSDLNFSNVLTRAKEIILEKLSLHQETKFFTRRPEVLTKLHKDISGLMKQT